MREGNNNNNNKEIIEFTKRYFYYVVIALVIIIPLVYMFIPNFGKKTEKVNYLSNIPNPIQKKSNGLVYDKLDGNEVRIYLNYEYSISGRVLHFADYSSGGKWHERLVPFDLGLGWGPLSGPNLDKYFTFEHLSNNYGRKLICASKKNEDTNKWLHNLGEEVINSHLSNNHLYPANKEVFNELKKIKKNECIRLDGYLIRVETTLRDGTENFMESSYVRTDTGDTPDGACEVIYVTDVTWLIDG